MARYHVGKNGLAALCSATVKRCPLGEEVHGEFDDPRVAQAFAETVLAGENGGVFSKVAAKSPLKKEDLSHIHPGLAEVIFKGSAQEMIQNGDAMIESSKTKVLEELVAFSERRREANFEDEYEGDRPPWTGYGPEDPDAKEKRLKKRREHPHNKLRAEIIRSGFPGKIHEAAQDLLDYYEGRSDAWCGISGSGSPQNDPEYVIRRIPSFTEEALERDATLLELAKQKDRYKAKEFSPGAKANLEKLCAAKGFELQEAIMLSPNKAQVADAQAFAEENGIDFKDGTELLFHGTSRGNTLSILETGFKQNSGVHKSGSAAGEAFYFSNDPAVAAAFGIIRQDEDYPKGDDDKVTANILLCKVVTGGPERTLSKPMPLSADGKVRAAKRPKLLGRNAKYEKNVALRLTLNVPKGNPANDYDEVTVRDHRQIIPVGILRVRGEHRRAV